MARAMDAGELLSRSDPFASLDAAAVTFIVGASREEDVARHTQIFAEGDEAQALYLILSGRVAVSNRAEDGRESLVALLETGDLFGEMGLFDGAGRSAGARALEAARLLVVPYPAVRDAMARQPSVLWDALGLLARRLRTADAALADTVFLDVLGRTAKRLLELSDGADDFRLPVTQEELAGMVGASRERVNKAIATFVRLGWIDQRGRHYRILRRDALAHRAR